MSMSLHKGIASGLLAIGVTSGAILLADKPSMTNEAIEACAESLVPPVETKPNQAPDECYGLTIRAFEFAGGVAIMQSPDDFRAKARELQEDDKHRDVAAVFACVGLGLGAGVLTYKEWTRDCVSKPGAQEA